MKQCIDPEALYKLGSGLCRRLLLPQAAKSEVIRNWLGEPPMPLHFSRDGAEVWLDKYYAAYRRGKGEVKYVYLTLRHISEEEEDRAEYEKERGFARPFPDEIEKAFSCARWEMERRGCAYLCGEIVPVGDG